MRKQKQPEPEFLVVDLFCGAGGTTLGFYMAKNNMAKVIMCVNHDHKAIKSHWANHPDVKHFEEDILTLDLRQAIALVNKFRKKYPNAKLILWASLECTNFSKAKGGQPRDADSRTLAWGLIRYIESLNPDYIQIENVVEFMSWGPLDENGKPVSRKNGTEWLKWREFICNKYGYQDQWRELNSADFGAYTSRNRLFGIFAKGDLPIVFPEPTHAKKISNNGIFGDLKKWKPVKDVLDFTDEGKSIFNRSTPLVDASLERIYAGLIKFVAGGKEQFLIKYNSMNQSGVYQAPSVDEPCPTIACQNRLGVVNTSFIQKSFSGRPEGKVQSIEQPAGTITTVDHHNLVQPAFLAKYYGNGDNTQSVEVPAGTITVKDRISKVECFLSKYNTGNPDNMVQSTDEPAATLTTKDTLSKLNVSFLDEQYGSGKQFSSVEKPCGALLNTPKQRLIYVQTNYWIDKQYSGDKNHQSIEQPAGAILANDKHCLMKAEPFIVNTNFGNKASSIENPAPTVVASRRYLYLLNPSHGGHVQSIENPCPVIIARQDKSPLYMINAIEGGYTIPVYDGDSEILVKIKEFMSLYGIVDIKMRMLKVPELLKIQGFPESYKLEGSQADMKKFIGNSVVPIVVKEWIEALSSKLKIYNVGLKKVTSKAA